MNIYILAPANRISGGPELSHQMCHAINTLTDSNAYICYVDVSAPFDKALCFQAEIPQPYRIYQTSSVHSLSELDQIGNIVVFPEGLTLSM